VANILAEGFPPIDLQALLALVEREAEFHDALVLPKPICDDPDDDKFLACAIASGGKIIVSGDKHLLKVSGFNNIEIIKPRIFVDTYLSRIDVNKE
jgi:predicted nucleic acid-binding protein